ncbi:MAG: TrkH family potassium uptake protein [Acidimicrobiales bacterium]|nr:TrkH family potassium uptake protein [Acidimicrobiales bacterium]
MIGVSLVLMVPGMVVSALLEWVDAHGDDELPLLAAALFTLVIGTVARQGSSVERARTDPASVFAAVAWTWVACSVAGALPYVFAGTFAHWDDAWFEAVSGFTATGSTVMADIEANGRGLLMWRQLTQWYGGMGLVVLAVSVLPFLGVGGLGLISAEAPGPQADRLAPRVSDTARRLWAMYVGITAAIAAGLLACGLSLYDAVAHSFTAVATGGFSPYNQSIGVYDSVAAELVIVAGLIVSSISFTLHWRFLHRDWLAYARSDECRAYLGILAAAVAVIVVGNRIEGLGSVPTLLRHAVFNVATIASTAGFGNATGADSLGNFVLWSSAGQMVLLLLLAVGGMAGSTAGGLKILRVLVTARHSRREFAKYRHPRAVLPVTIDRTRVTDEILSRTFGFILMFFTVTVVATMALVAFGSDLVTSLSSVLTAMSGVGPGLGDTGPVSNFLAIARPGRAVLAVVMLIGRLEIVAVLLMFVAPIRALRR